MMAKNKNSLAVLSVTASISLRMLILVFVVKFVGAQSPNEQPARALLATESNRFRGITTNHHHRS